MSAQAHPTKGGVRVLRSGLFAGATVALAAAAHAVAGGEVPRGLAVFAALALTLVAHRLAGRRRGPAAIGAAMGLTQVVLHEAFMLWTSSTCVADGAGHHAIAAMHCGGTHSPVASGGPAMTSAHAAAAVLLGLLLVRGETALWALCSQALPGWRTVVAVATGAVQTVPRTRTAPAGRVPRPRPPDVWRTSCPRRGPPVVAVAA